jgi:methionine-S-sulfoxide reductase
MNLSTTTMKRMVKVAITGSALSVALVFTAFLHKPSTEPALAFMGSTETAVFAGGCFWGLQTAFDELPGVIGTRVGYAGGTMSTPTYGQVVAGHTGHAEAVEVVFDPSRLSFEQVTRHFFKRHRPKSDEPYDSYRKRAYRSAIFVSNPAQREVAERIRNEFVERNAGGKPVATLIEDASNFLEAEAYHQNYLAKCAH